MRAACSWRRAIYLMAYGRCDVGLLSAIALPRMRIRFQGTIMVNGFIMSFQFRDRLKWISVSRLQPSPVELVDVRFSWMPEAIVRRFIPIA